MDQGRIFLPFAGMLVLTLTVLARLFQLRIRTIRATHSMPKTRADLDRFPVQAVNVSNNFQNLFEVPVLFYACVLALYVLQQVDIAYLVCAYGFLVCRVIHSAIHCTYNRIVHRFSAYLIATLFLIVMVIRFAWSVI